MVNNQSLDELLRRLATFQTDATNFGVPGDISQVLRDLRSRSSQMERNHVEAQESIVSLRAEVNRLNAEVNRLNEEVSTIKSERKKCNHCGMPEDFLACRNCAAEV